MTLAEVQESTRASVQAQCDRLNAAAVTDFQTLWANWTHPILDGRKPIGDPPTPPASWVVREFADPTTGPGSNGQYQSAPVMWAYPSQSGPPVCPQPPIPTPPAPPQPNPPRLDILNVPLGDTFPVGHMVTDPSSGRVYQKQSSPTPFGTAYWYQQVSA